VRIVDSHFHWWPRSIFEALCERTGYPRAERDGKGGYNLLSRRGVQSYLPVWAEWFDLDKQFEHMDALGHQVDAFGSIGPFSVHFSDLPVEEGREARSSGTKRWPARPAAIPDGSGQVLRYRWSTPALRWPCSKMPSAASV